MITDFRLMTIGLINGKLKLRISIRSTDVDRKILFVRCILQNHRCNPSLGSWSIMHCQFISRKKQPLYNVLNCPPNNLCPGSRRILSHQFQTQRPWIQSAVLVAVQLNLMEPNRKYVDLSMFSYKFNFMMNSLSII